MPGRSHDAICANTIAVVRSLNRGQLQALLAASSKRDKAAMAGLEEDWLAAERAEPDIVSTFDAVVDEQAEKDLPRFEKHGKEDSREFSKFLQGEKGRPMVWLAVIALILPVVTAISTLVGSTPVAVLLASPIAAALLFVIAGVLAHRLFPNRRFFSYPESAARQVWVAATDAAAAQLLRGSVGKNGLTDAHLDRLETIWLEAGMTTGMLNFATGDQATSPAIG